MTIPPPAWRWPLRATPISTDPTRSVCGKPQPPHGRPSTLAAPDRSGTLHAPTMARAKSAPSAPSSATIGFEAKLWLTADKLRNNIRLERIYPSKSIMAWSEIFKDAICAKLEITDEEDRARPFYRELADSDWEKIKTMAGRLLTWTQWPAPQNSEIESQLSNAKTVLKAWFKEKGLTTGYLLGTIRVKSVTTHPPMGPASHRVNCVHPLVVWCSQYGHKLRRSDKKLFSCE